MADVVGRAARAAAASDGEPGRLVSIGMVQSGIVHDGIAREVSARRRTVRDALAGEFACWLLPEVAGAMTGHVAAVLQGMAVQAKTKATWEIVHIPE